MMKLLNEDGDDACTRIYVLCDVPNPNPNPNPNLGPNRVFVGGSLRACKSVSWIKHYLEVGTIVRLVLAGVSTLSLPTTSMHLL